MKRRGFTLIEMLVACVVVALVMAAVLMVLTHIGNDRRMLEAAGNRPRHDALVNLIRWDVTNASTMTPLRNGAGVVLFGNGGLDSRTLAPAGRLARVTYRVINTGGRQNLLVREQETVDAAFEGKHDKRVEIAAIGVEGMSLLATSPDAEPVVVPDATAAATRPAGNATSGSAGRLLRGTFRIPSRVRVRVDFAEGAVDEEFRVR